MNSIAEVVHAMGRMRVLVIGEAMLDRYIAGPSRRLSPEAPVPVVSVETCADYPGGAANTAVNCAAMGARTTLVTLIGDDRAGSELHGRLLQGGVGVDPASIVADRTTLAKTRVSAGDHLLVRFDEGDTTPPADGVIDCLRTAIARHWMRADAVIISDYNYGVLSEPVRDCIAQLQAEHPRILAVDARDLSAYRSHGAAIAKPNLSEAQALLRNAGACAVAPGAEAIAEHAPDLLDLTGAHCVAVTLGSDGAVLLRPGCEPYRTQTTRPARAFVSGAGDTYLAAFALALGAGGTHEQAATIASMAAEVVVGQTGTSPCRASDLLRDVEPRESPLTDEAQLVHLLATERARGRRIVFTNGVFDILHSGHVHYLAEARAQGDLLVVALNSDASVSRLKGPARPINALADRAAVLSSLSCVDYVTSFEEDTPERLLRLLKPDVFVKGGDYTIETLPEASAVIENGGRVVILDYLAGHSTTGVIERVLQRPARALRKRHHERFLREVAG